MLEALAHDLRSPMTAVLGAAVTLQRDGAGLSDQIRARLVGAIVSSARTIERMLDDLLDGDRIAHGALELDPHEIEVNDLLRRIVKGMRLERRVTVQDPVYPITARLDQVRLTRIVENLVANAIRHATGEARVWVSAARYDGGVLVAVEDDGPGIPDERKGTIFEPYARGEGSVGTGIGLTIVRRFASAVGGRAWVEDRPGGGASFKVLLPG